MIGGYDVDDEGVRPQRVSIVENGILKDLLMSRRPGPEFYASNGHARSALLSDTHPLPSNLIFESNAGRESCRFEEEIPIASAKTMDTSGASKCGAWTIPRFLPSARMISTKRLAGLAAGISSGEKLPLLLYRVYVSDGHEELVRGGMLNGLTLRSIRNLAGIGNDVSVFDYLENPSARICRHGARRFRLGAVRDSQLDRRAFAFFWKKEKFADSTESRAACLSSPNRLSISRRFRLRLDCKDRHFRPAVESDRQQRCADPAIHVHLRFRPLGLVPSRDVGPASFRQP